MVEESPGIKVPGVTEVLSLLLHGTTLRVGPSQSHAPGAAAVGELDGSPQRGLTLDHGAPGGLVVTLAVKHIAVNDTQACVEHRHVLSGAAEEVRAGAGGAIVQVLSLRRKNSASERVNSPNAHSPVGDSPLLPPACHCCGLRSRLICMQKTFLHSLFKLIV